MRKKICLIPSVLNEAKALDKFLEYHFWADEVAVLDSGSTDETEEICKKYGRKLLKMPLKGNHNKRCAWATRQVKEDWVFLIDPDEFITSELKLEIDKILESDEDTYQAYQVRRTNFFMGKPLNHGGWSNYGLKLLKPAAVSFRGDSYHEHPIVDGRIGYLKGKVEHYPSPNIHWVIQKFNYISEFDLNEYRKLYGILTPRKFKWLLFTKPFKNFWKCYVKKKGYRDGLYGFVYAALIWACDVIRICKYGERFLLKNPNIITLDKLPDPWGCRK